MTRDNVTLSAREQQWGQVLTQVLEGRLPVREAARLLGHSIRHIRRLLARVRTHGPAALAHGNRGRALPRRLAEKIRARIVALARGLYAGCNDSHFSELLAEREGLRVSRATVSGCSARPASAVPAPAGPWLEDRGPHLVLHAAIDDATGMVLAAVFRLEEDAQGYFLLIRRLIQRYGLPAAVYTDRHGLFRRDPKTRLPLPEQLTGAEPTTQIGRALHQLGIKWIPASSAQAKGRVERLFGTFQDRLVIELRLANARTLAQAQRILDRFLPRYNARFAHPAAQERPAWRPAPPLQDLERICCFRYRRTVAQDNTIRVDGQWLQLLPGPSAPLRRLPQAPQGASRCVPVATVPRPARAPPTRRHPISHGDGASRPACS